MKKLYFLVVTVMYCVTASAQIISFSDAYFKARLLQAGVNSFIAQGQSGNNILIDTNGDSEIDAIEAQAVYRLNLQDASMVNAEGLNYFINLGVLTAAYNYFSNLDVSALTNLYALDVSYNSNLVNLNIKNGMLGFAIPPPPPIPIGVGNVSFLGCPNLVYVCCDEDKIEEGNSYLSVYGLTNITINDYCDFTPGGIYYTIEGTSKMDANTDGCDVLDVNYPNLKLNINNGSNSSNFFTSTNGNYLLSLPQGAYTITPILENLTYFQVNPTSFSVNFPADTTPFTQNFCISPNGVHPDLDVTILPVTAARPGFDSSYKIIYKNKGTQTQSGTINLTFNDTVLDFVTSNLAIDSQVVNNLTWNFTNLQPFESREIVVTLNVNSPSEVPPINAGDILNFTASVNSSLTDETPDDNTFALNQTVVNSFDPNDKTCLEGNTITPEMVGKEVHYLIRFENTGNANAENVVVKDMIDTAKFDVNSLIPVGGSHSFVTKISNSNKVEFIFENINLPFDDANNDGYVAFKIKTKPTLVLGDTFSNTASIYFDYNFPIVTDPAVTTVALLVNSDFVFDNYFSIYPNPTNSILNIETKKTIEVTSINIYNVLGQVVLVIPNAQQTKSVDVSSLKTGNYFIKIVSDKGSSSMKFVKL